ncbi:MAG: TetR family transcriptional regulator [Alphaproteobacteria bacterium]|nr:TetR family transcriptional regulator [Alphaproteobacteria bacterium]
MKRPAKAPARSTKPPARRKAPASRGNVRPAPPHPLTPRERDRVLAASRAVFNTKGFEKTTIGDIAERARLDAGAIRRQFRNKETLFAAIMEQRLEEDLDVTEEALRLIGAETRDPQIAIEKFLAVQLARHASDRRWRRIYIDFFTLAPRGVKADLVAIVEARIAQRSLAFITFAQSRGMLDPQIPPGDFFILWSALLDGMALRRASSQAMPDIPETARALARMLTRGIVRAG